MTDLLKQSQEIVAEAIAQHQPEAHILMFSGGGDSMACYQACKALGVRIDYLLHVNTRTGIPQTTEFVRQFAESEGLKYIEADAGTAYEDYVRRKGFFGVGTGGRYSAHTMAYHVLKKQRFRSAIAKLGRGIKVLLLNGARASESDNRALGIASSPIRTTSGEPNRCWVNVINHWEKTDCKTFCGECKAPKNPVSELLCRSGECMCGTTQGQKAREEAAYWFPEWGQWLDNLEAEVMQKFPWGWGQPVSQYWQREQKGQMKLFDDDFQPMCTSCIAQPGQEGAA